MNLKNQLEDIGPANTPTEIDSVVVPKSKMKLFLPVLAGLVVALGLGGVYVYKTIQHTKQQQASGFNAAMAQQGAGNGLGGAAGMPPGLMPPSNGVPMPSNAAPNSMPAQSAPVSQGVGVPGFPLTASKPVPAGASLAVNSQPPAIPASATTVATNQPVPASDAAAGSAKTTTAPGMLVAPTAPAEKPAVERAPQREDRPESPCSKEASGDGESMQKDQDKVMGIKHVKHAKWSPHKKSASSAHAYDDDAVTSEQILIVQ